MLTKVLETYAAAFRLIIKNPIFISVSAINIAISLASDWGNGFLPKIIIVLLTLLGAYAATVVPMIILLIALQAEGKVASDDLYLKIRSDFWKFIGQGLAGLFLAVLYSSPFFCLLLLSTILKNKMPFWILLFLSTAVLQYLALGSVDMAQRMLLEKGGKIFENSINGLRMINHDFRYYLSLATIQILLATTIMSGFYFLGSTITGIQLFPKPALGIYDSLLNANKALYTPAVAIGQLFVGSVITPLTSVAITLSYTRIKTHAKFRIPFRRTSS